MPNILHKIIPLNDLLIIYLNEKYYLAIIFFQFKDFFILSKVQPIQQTPTSPRSNCLNLGWENLA